MRGKVDTYYSILHSVWITPACAGKSIRSWMMHSSTWDHPRVCGENLMSFTALWYAVGSPPRVRGKVDAATLTLKARGITPACAGKRKLSHCELLPRWDHPRVCGEKSCIKIVLPWILGSPPRMRGKVIGACSLSYVNGITPAYAGKRRFWSRRDTLD